MGGRKVRHSRNLHQDQERRRGWTRWLEIDLHLEERRKEREGTGQPVVSETPAGSETRQTGTGRPEQG